MAITMAAAPAGAQPSSTCSARLKQTLFNSDEIECALNTRSPGVVITITNIGIHPAQLEISRDENDIEICATVTKLDPSFSVTFAAATTDGCNFMTLSRPDIYLTTRTLSVRVDYGLPVLPGAAPAAQKLEGWFDALTCPRSGLSGSLTFLGFPVMLSAEAQFTPWSCETLAAFLDAGQSALLDVVLATGTGPLAATEVDLVMAGMGSVTTTQPERHPHGHVKGQ